MAKARPAGNALIKKIELPVILNTLKNKTKIPLHLKRITNKIQTVFKPSALHQGAFYVFISAAGFSVKAIFAKKAYEIGADPITLLFLRLLFAAPLFLLLAYWS